MSPFGAAGSMWPLLETFIQRARRARRRLVTSVCCAYAPATLPHAGGTCAELSSIGKERKSLFFPSSLLLGSVSLILSSAD